MQKPGRVASAVGTARPLPLPRPSSMDLTCIGGSQKNRELSLWIIAISINDQDLPSLNLPLYCVSG